MKCSIARSNAPGGGYRERQQEQYRETHSSVQTHCDFRTSIALQMSQPTDYCRSGASPRHESYLASDQTTAMRYGMAKPTAVAGAREDGDEVAA
jgi:hypothetical protein